MLLRNENVTACVIMPCAMECPVNFYYCYILPDLTAGDTAYQGYVVDGTPDSDGNALVAAAPAAVTGVNTGYGQQLAMQPWAATQPQQQLLLLPQQAHNGGAGGSVIAARHGTAAMRPTPRYAAADLRRATTIAEVSQAHSTFKCQPAHYAMPYCMHSMRVHERSGLPNHTVGSCLRHRTYVCNIMACITLIWYRLMDM